ncbi:hypothetical protein HQ533_01365 [Candidatus Woesearchaeota archaeon]|nr:hypothetical protein [Candidatus Woesearchaeota archaeon]
MKRGVLFLLLFLIPLAQAIDISVYIKDHINVTISYPQIEVVYNEPVDILDTEILRSDDVRFDVNYTTSDNVNYVMYAEEYLTNNDYELHILSMDSVGNPSRVIQPFTVDSPFMNIWIDSPELGVSSVEVFDVVVKTGDTSDCKYSPVPLPPPQIDNFNFLFDSTGGTEHTITGISLNDNSPDEDGKDMRLYVKCVDENDLVHPTSLYLGYDPSPPSLGVTITPNPITDTQEPIAVLQVSSSDRAICSYNKDGVYYEFEGYDSDNFSAYKKEHYLELDFTELARRLVPQLFEEVIVDYDITCTNLAGLTSDTVQATARVAFEEEFSIEMKEPGRYIDDGTIIFEIETSIQTPGGCKYGEDYPDNDFTTVIGNKIYTEDFGALEEGGYSYEVSCIALTPRSKTFEFTVDRTKPYNVSVEVKDPSCSLSEVSGTFYGEDNISGIDRYNYSIMKGNDILAQGSTIQTFSEQLDLEEGANYRVSVIAYDEAGNFGEAQATFAAKDSDSAECDSTSPSTATEIFPTRDGVLVQVKCLDSESGCKDLFDYGISTDSEDCIASQFKTLDDGILFTESANLCWTVYDLNNNNASGSEFIEYTTAEDTYPAHCFNEMKDSIETDVDCGGECAACEGAANCLKNEDCISRSCNMITGTCGSPACDNSFRDGYETDIDCGGECSKCELGMNCEEDRDCVSDVCRSSVCSEDLNQDTDGDGMPDYWENQYGLDLNDPSDAIGDPDSDGFTNIDEFTAGTNPFDSTSHPPKAGTKDEPPVSDSNKKVISWTFILIGLILIIAGIAFLMLENQKKKKKLEPRLIDDKGEMPIGDELEEKKEGITLKKAEETFKKKSVEKKKKRKDLLKAFETDEKTAKIKELEEEPDKEAEKDETKTGEEKEDEEKKEGYVDISELKKEKDFKEEDVGENVFQELEMIKKETEGEKAKESTEEEETKKEEEIVEEKKEEFPLEVETEDKKEEEKEDLDQDDIFKKLADLAGQSHEDVKKAVDKEEVSSKDLMKVFANVTSKNHIDANVFKAILSQLLKRGQVSKQTVAEILFEFLDNKLMTKKEVSDLIKELKLTAR